MDANRQNVQILYFSIFLIARNTIRSHAGWHENKYDITND